MKNAFAIALMVHGIILGLLPAAMGRSPAFQPVVIAVGADSVTVQTGTQAGVKVTDKDADGSSHPEGPRNLSQYKVLKDTDITVDGLPGKLADVAVGMAAHVVEGVAQGTAASLAVHTVPPAPTPRPRKIIKATVARVRGEEEVLAVSDTRITVGVPGTLEAHAYYLTPRTIVTFNGEKDTVHPGDMVDIQNDGTTARVIEIYDNK